MSVDRKALQKGLRTNFSPGPRDYLNRAALRLRQAAHLPAYLFDGALDRPVFIIGAPRSGTSMLYAILRRSSKLAHWPGEAHEVWEADYHPALSGWSSNALAASDAHGEAARRIRRRFFLVTGSRKRLIDKTPRNALRVAFIDALFPDARYLFLTRDGRDNVNSLINAWRTPRYRTYALERPHSIPGVDPKWWKFTLYPRWQEDSSGPLELVCAKQWTCSYDRALQGFGNIGRERWLQVSYEGLTDEPEAAVERIMDFLALPFEDVVRARAKAAETNPVNVVTPPERGKWRRENPQEIAAILSLITPTMRALGYETDED
ncbi:MAG: sulfotransferase family protein [Actinomycetota bacterium]